METSVRLTTTMSFEVVERHRAMASARFDWFPSSWLSSQLKSRMVSRGSLSLASIFGCCWLVLKAFWQLARAVALAQFDLLRWHDEVSSRRDDVSKDLRDLVSRQPTVPEPKDENDCWDAFPFPASVHNGSASSADLARDRVTPATAPNFSSCFSRLAWTSPQRSLPKYQSDCEDHRVNDDHLRAPSFLNRSRHLYPIALRLMWHLARKKEKIETLIISRQVNLICQKNLSFHQDQCSTSK